VWPTSSRRPGRALQLLQRRHRDLGRNARGHGKARGDKRVGHLEITGQRHVDLEDLRLGMNFGDLLVAEMLDPLQRQIVTLAPDGAHD
jgi:hypothetical protein